MKHLQRSFLKPLTFLPALLMMYVIFGFSAQNGEVSGNLSYEISYRIVTIGNELLDKEMEEWQIEDYAHEIEHPIRKLAHMTEYFLLAVFVSFPLYIYGVRGLPLILASVLFCAAFAAGDEYHQSFVAGREPSVKDVMIDSAGALLGTLCYFFSARYLSDQINTRKRDQQ